MASVAWNMYVIALVFVAMKVEFSIVKNQKANKRANIRPAGGNATIITDGSTQRSALFFNCAELPFQPNWHMSSHAHSDVNELIIVGRGALKVEIEGREIVAEPGDVLNYPRGVVHEEWSVGREPLRSLYIVWRDQGRDVASNLPIHVHDRRDRVRMLARWMISLNSEEPDLRSRAELQARLLSAILHEMRAVRGPAEDERLERVRRHLHSRLSASPTLDALAQIAGVSRFHFIRLFRGRFGVTPMEYLRRQRIDAAKVMIRSTRQPLRLIAPMVGFGDEFHLSKAFKSRVGVSPGAYRKAARPS